MDGQCSNLVYGQVKKKCYSWITVPMVGNDEQETVLTVPDGKGGHLIVVPVEKFFSTLKSLHESSGHARMTTMMKKINSLYSCLPKSAVKTFLEGCIGCQCRAAQVNEAEPQQILAKDVFSRVQVDLIDMTMKPSSGNRYIVHLMDHFSKFHMVDAVERKTTSAINQCLIKMFGTIGLPNIIQTDNGTEFFKLGDIFKDWPGGSDVRIIHGRPRHPQSQGLVEKGHQLIQDRLAIAEAEWLRDNDTPFLWHNRLPVIQFQVNTVHSRVIGTTPYDVVFGRRPKPPPVFGGEGVVLDDAEPSQLDHSYSRTDEEPAVPDENEPGTSAWTAELEKEGTDDIDVATVVGEDAQITSERETPDEVNLDHSYAMVCLYRYVYLLHTQKHFP